MQEPILREHIPTHEIAFQVLKGTDVVVNDYMRLPLVEAWFVSGPVSRRRR